MALKRIQYGWVIVLVGAGILAACSLGSFTFGVFLRPLAVEFGWERGALSLAPSIASIVTGFSSIVTGKLCDKYGPRILVTFSGIMMGAGFMLMSQIGSLIQVYIIWGLCIGLAIGCSVVPIISTIPRWFVHNRSIAVGIVTAGFGLGAMVSPILAQALISASGLETSFLILAVVAWAFIIPLAQFIRQSPDRVDQRIYGELEDMEDKTKIWDYDKGLTLLRTLRTTPFWIFGAINFLWFFCLQGIVIHIIPRANDIGITDMVAASILSTMSAISVFGRLSIGFVSNVLGVRRSLSLCLLLGTLALWWLLFAQEIWALYIWAIFFGLAYGGLMPLVTLVPSELFGVKSLGVIIGIFLFFQTIGGAGGPPVAGYIFDTTGSYHLAFITIAAGCTIAAILGLFLLRYKAGILANAPRGDESASA